MSCKCKNEVSEVLPEKKISIFKFILRFILFLLTMVILSPFILILFGWILFKNFVLSESINLLPMVANIKKIMKINKLEKEESV